MKGGAQAAPKLYLASSSPRRIELLLAAGIAFAQIEPGPEPEGTGTPHERALQRAQSKARPALLPPAPGCVLGVDTVVALGGVEFGKARDAAEAAAMLEALAGRVHAVHSAHCLLDLAGGRMLSRITTARVRCIPDPAAIRRYVAGGTWRGKAGAYGIQDPDCTFMELVEGELDTVIGMSVEAVRDLLDRDAAGAE